MAAPSIAAVAFPIAIPGVYDYAIPPALAGRVTEGTPVLVEVRSRRLWGMVVQLKERSEFSALKQILDVKPVMNVEAFRAHAALYEWIAAYYQCELGAVFRPFVRKGLMQSSAKEVTAFRLAARPLPEDLTARQRQAVERLTGLAAAATRVALTGRYGISDHMVRALCGRGVLEAVVQQVERTSDELRMAPTRDTIALTAEQVAAVERMKAAFDAPERPFLLHGITGSGKTHVYIELVKYSLSRGRGAIVLVPEISLTPQTIQRFVSAVGDTVAVIHSHMSEGERRDSLEALMEGRRRVVIGVRSAILAPLPDLGLIVVDEEHDASYKQADLDPRYHARDVAIMRAKLQSALVVLGSATPCLETWYNGRQGKYEVVHLAERFGPATLPAVTLIDMNEEHRADNWTLLSRYLRTRLEETLGARRQAILLLNRRGYSTFLLCKDCGFIHSCPNCSVKLVYHQADGVLLCHQCGHAAAAPSSCPLCAGEHLRYKGSGIQKAEELLREAWPQAAIVRMDQDTTRRKGSHVSIVEEMEAGKIDILLGTQMVAKGLNFPGVALVGVLQADTGLHVPDFRAGERTFQLLTQVAGRAGRADSLGEVVIQTYMPDDPSVAAAKGHDFLTFAERELASREALTYPPFCRLARVVVSGPVKAQAEDLAVRMAAWLRASGGKAFTMLGPSPAVIERLKSAWRYSLLIKSASSRKLQEALTGLRREFLRQPKGLRYLIDVDPQNMM